MKKQQKALSQNPPPQQPLPSVPVTDTRSFGRTFLIKKGNVLAPEPEIAEDAEPEKVMMTTDEFHKIIRVNRAALFGERTLGISTQIGEEPFNAFTFLFDFSGEKPRCFILSTILSEAPFDFCFMELTRIFGFLRNLQNCVKIVDALAADIQSDKQLTKAFRECIGKEMPIDAFLSLIVITTCRVLWLTDGRRPQLPELVETYPEVWRNMLSIMYIEKYQVGKLSILSVYPPLAELGVKPKQKKQREPKVIHTLEHHFGLGSDEVKAIYEKLTAAVMKIDKSVIFVPDAKHYIAMKKPGAKSMALLHFRKNSLYIVVKIDEKIVRKLVKNHAIHSLKPSVQKFWGASSTGLVIKSTDHLKEIVEVLKKLIKG